MGDNSNSSSDTPYSDSNVLEENVQRRSVDWNAILGGASHVATIILALFAIYAYFTTVKPLHQNALLSEQVARREIELASLTGELESIEPSVRSLEEERATLEATLEGLAFAISEAEKEAATQRREYASLTAEFNELSSDYLEAQIRLEDARETAVSVYRAIVVENLKGSLASNFLNLIFEDVSGQSEELDFANHQSTYELLAVTLDQAQVGRLDVYQYVPKEFESDVLIEIRAALESEKLLLNNTISDFDHLAFRYAEEARKIESGQSDSLEMRMDLRNLEARYSDLYLEAVQKEVRRAEEFLSSFSGD